MKMRRRWWDSWDLSGCHTLSHDSVFVLKTSSRFYSGESKKPAMSCVKAIVVAIIAGIIYSPCSADSPIIFPEDNDDTPGRRLLLETDDMDYELDNEGDSHVPQIPIPRNEYQDYVRLPDKNGEFEVVSRFLVKENRDNATKYEAMKYMKFMYYARSNNGTALKLSFEDMENLPHQHGFKVGVPTKILIHGWLGSSESDVIGTLAKEFLKHGDFNVIAVDWEQGAKTLLYPVARYRVPKVAFVVADVINKMLDFGQSPDQIGIVGHSLGAHIAGIAGKNTNSKIAFIIGLDPASPLFRYKNHNSRLTENDAQYVEVIHTNGKALGLFKNIGKADFYPNGGIQQPGCGWNLACSHQRSVDYFIESLNAKDYFAERCAGVSNLGSGCKLGRAALGGFELRKLVAKATGVYYALTASNGPFLRSN